MPVITRVSDVLVRLLLRRGRNGKFLKAEVDTFLTYIVKSLSTVLLGTELLGLDTQAHLGHGFTFLDRDSTLVFHHLLVVFRDSLLDFLGNLFTSLISFVKFGLVLGGINFLRVGLEAELDFPVVIDDLLLSLSHDFLATFISSSHLDLNCKLGLLSGIGVINLLALINLFVVVGYTLLDSGSSF